MTPDTHVPEEVQRFIDELPLASRPRFGTYSGVPCLLLSSPQDSATALRAERLGFRPLDNAPGWALPL